ncbi:bZIP transcription factor 17-like [Salvia miltiorrhiza]|uniref:bZIP transcription factor 17-like n=1 Tax=Salvia miltiorrhiza TaxID=226208 RepID=UPI0025AD912D|nr:bZIP transcription factor 17-like [Salvia miltiorrhiza]
MAEATVVAVDPPTEPPPDFGDFGCGLQIAPLDDGFFSHHVFNGDGVAGENGRDDVVVLEDLDFDFSFDDLGLPPADDLDHLLNPSQLRQFHSQPRVDPSFAQVGSNYEQMHSVFKSSSSELRHLSGDGDFSGNRSCDGSGLMNSTSPDTESQQISAYLNMPSPESNGSNRGSADNGDDDGKGLNCPSPDSQGSGNFESHVSEDSNNCVARSVSSSPNSSNSSVRNSVVDQKIKLEDPASNNSSISLLKRKKEGEDLTHSDSRIKYRKSNCNAENNNSSNSNEGLSEEDEKRKARLLRNRESAQLSRQRKKHYVEELEDKVRSMHSTIQDLNSKISYFMAENATLRQQMGGGGGAPAPPAAAPPPMAPPPPGMYTHPAMMYPWMPYAQPYMMKSQGSQVPLVPIPRLKPQQPAQAPKPSRKVEGKKNDGPKTRKVAGVSFLGLLFFIMLFGGLAPMVNVRYGGAREAFTGGQSYITGGFSEKHRGRVLMVNGTEFDEIHGGRIDYSSNGSVRHGQRGQASPGDPSADESVRLGNGSEPLAASLYVPRNDKLVKIDGNLIIHSVLASEKAMASNRNGGGETGLAVPGDLAPAIPGQDMGRNGARHPLLRALGAADKDGMKSTATDGRLQQWFREGLAGPMLSAGMCTEVFQFDTSAASGAIVPASTSRNISEAQSKNSSKARNRRILHPIPLPESSHNISGEHTRRRSEKEDLNINKNTSSMVVSVLFDPREVSDAEVDGVMGTKSLSRIFVVVLMDSVRYVTYSCMLPFKAAPHLVTA